jgi:hypothetical protein
MPMAEWQKTDILWQDTEPNLHGLNSLNTGVMLQAALSLSYYV